MHILIPTGIFHPEPGGPATYLYHFLPELQRRGHSVEVITFSDDTPSETYPYPVQRIPRTNLAHRNWAYRQAVAQKQARADLLYIHSLGLWLPKLKRPSVLKIVGDRAWERCLHRGWLPPTEDIDQFQTARYGPLIEWLKAGRAKEARAVEAILVPSEYLKRMVAGWGVPSERIQVVYNAFEPDPSPPPPPPSRASLGLHEGPLLLMVGRLTAWKGGDYLLPALLPHPDLQALIIGDGPLLGAWQAMTAYLGLGGRVKFLGKLAPQQVRAYYPLADYTLLYSGYEGLSHVILESLAAGTPVIASDKGGNPEVITHGQNGLLVPYADTAALTTALGEAFAEDRPQKLRAGATFDPGRFSWPRLLEQTFQLLEQVGGGLK